MSKGSVFTGSASPSYFQAGGAGVNNKKFCPLSTAGAGTIRMGQSTYCSKKLDKIFDFREYGLRGILN